MLNSPYVTRQVLAIKLVDKFYYKLRKKALFWYSSYPYNTKVLNRTSYEFSTGLKQVVATRDDVYIFPEIRLTLVRHDRWLIVRLRDYNSNTRTGHSLTGGYCHGLTPVKA